MKTNPPVTRAAKTRPVLDIDLTDPRATASFLLRLEFSVDSVVTAVERRCRIDRITARRIVDDAARNLQEV